MLSRSTVVDPDLFHELSLAREIVTTGSIPRRDAFAYTPTVDPVVHHEWGTGLVLYGTAVSSGWGGSGLLALKYLVGLGLGAGAVACARARGASAATISFLAPIALGLGWIGFGTVRAQLFTLLFAVLWLWLLTFDLRGRRWWVLVAPLLFLVWLNMHAGFVVGLGLLGLHAAEVLTRELGTHRNWGRAGRRVAHLLAAGAIMLAILPVNPYGWDYLHYLWHALRMPRTLIGEWGSLWQQDSVGWPLLFAISLAAVGCSLFRRGRGVGFGLSIVCVTAWLAMRHIRHLSLYAAIWLCLVPAWVDGTALGDAMNRVWRKLAGWLAAVWLVCGLLGVVHACQQEFWRVRMPTSCAAAREGVPVYPAGVTAYLSEHAFQGNLMVPFEAGGFVSWELYPAVKVSIDSRYEVAYPPGAVEESVAFYQAQPGWQETLDRYPTDAVLVPRWSRLADVLEQSREATLQDKWQRVYRDGAYLLFVRRGHTAGLPRVDRNGAPIVASFP